MKKKERLAKKRDRRVRREVNKHLSRLIDSRPTVTKIAELAGDEIRDKMGRTSFLGEIAGGQNGRTTR